MVGRARVPASVHGTARQRQDDIFVEFNPDKLANDPAFPNAPNAELCWWADGSTWNIGRTRIPTMLCPSADSKSASAGQSCLFHQFGAANSNSGTIDHGVTSAARRNSASRTMSVLPVVWGRFRPTRGIRGAACLETAPSTALATFATVRLIRLCLVNTWAVRTGRARCQLRLES